MFCIALWKTKQRETFTIADQFTNNKISDKEESDFKTTLEEVLANTK